MAGFVYNGGEFPSIKSDSPNARSMKIIVSPEVNGYNEATVLFAYIPPGSSTGRHTHPGDEIIYIIGGRGEGYVGDEVTKLEADSVILALRGVEHECRNTSETETLKLFCVFIPPLEPSPLLEKLIDKTREYLKGK